MTRVQMVVRGHFGTRAILRALLKEGPEHDLKMLSWLSSLASQDGAAGGMTGSSTAAVLVVTAPVPVATAKCPTLDQRRSWGTSLLLPQCSRRQHLWWCTLRRTSSFTRCISAPFSMRCSSTSREHRILAAVAHLEGVHLPRFKAAEWISLYSPVGVPRDGSSRG